MHCEDCALSKGVIRVRDDLAVEIKCDRLLVQLGKAEVEVFPGRDSAPSECFGGGGGEAGGQDDPRGTACTSSCGGRVANDLLPASILGQSSKTGLSSPLFSAIMVPQEDPITSQNSMQTVSGPT